MGNNPGSLRLRNQVTGWAPFWFRGWEDKENKKNKNGNQQGDNEGSMEGHGSELGQSRWR